MPRIRFTKDYDWSPKRNVVIAYKAGNEYLVKQQCADDALAAKVGVPVKAKKNDDGE